MDRGLGIGGYLHPYGLLRRCKGRLLHLYLLRHVIYPQAPLVPSENAGCYILTS